MSDRTLTPAPSDRPWPLKLFVRSGLAAGTAHTATGAFVIGRGSGCLVRLKDEVVSRAHCKLFWEEGRWWIEDLKSANGLFIDDRRVERHALQERTLARLGADGPAIEMVVTTPPPPAVKAPADLEHYKSHYFGDAEGPAGEHTLMVRRAFAEVQHKQRKLYYAIIGGVALLLVLSSAYAVYRHVQYGRQRQLAADIFYKMKAQEVLLAQIITATEQQRSAEASARIEALKQRQSEMEASYNEFTDTLKVYAKGLSAEERLILKMARAFGECELTIPDGFNQTVQTYIARWKESGRLQRAVTRARNKGYAPTIARALTEQGLPAQFFYLALQESNLDLNAVGPPTRFGIAKGMWQFIPTTAQKYGLRTGPLAEEAQPDPQDERHHFDRATLAAARYLRDIYATDAQASGLLVMAAYNWGEHRVVPLLQTLPQNPRERNFWELLTKYRRKIPDETYDYVFSIFSAAVIGEDPKLFGFDFDNPLAEPPTPAHGK
ncbi:MAG: FHA domain-containing protein [Desulfatitalea sp.]